MVEGGGGVLPRMPNFRWRDGDEARYSDTVSRAKDRIQLTDDNQDNVNKVIGGIVDAAQVMVGAVTVTT